MTPHQQGYLMLLADALALWFIRKPLWVELFPNARDLRRQRERAWLRKHQPVHKYRYVPKHRM